MKRRGYPGADYRAARLGCGAMVLVLALGLLAGPWAAGQRIAQPPIPIAATPSKTTPQAPTVSPEPKKLAVIATTRPAAPPQPITTAPPAVQPVAGWPGFNPATSLLAERKPDEPGYTASAVPPPSVLSASLGAALSLTKVVPEGSSSGKPLNYTISLRNVGSVAGYRVRVEDQLPPGSKHLFSEPKATESEGRLVWEVGTLEAGAELLIQVGLHTTAAVDPQAYAACVTFASGKGLESAEIRQQLALAVTATEKSRVGETVVLQMTLVNTGTSMATNVLLHEQLPDGLRHPAGKEIEADLGTLAPGESKSITLEVSAAQAGRMVSQATATADGIPPSVVQTIVVVKGPALLVRVEGPTAVGSNQELEYVFEAINSGMEKAALAHLAISLPEGLQLVAVGEGGSGQPDGRSVEWALGSLDAGQSRRASLKLRARSPGEWFIRTVLRAEELPEFRSERAVRVER